MSHKTTPSPRLGPLVGIFAALVLGAAAMAFLALGGASGDDAASYHEHGEGAVAWSSSDIPLDVLEAHYRYRTRELLTLDYPEGAVRSTTLDQSILADRLNDSGATPLISDGDGAAFWRTCGAPIAIELYFGEDLSDSQIVSAYSATYTAIRSLHQLTNMSFEFAIHTPAGSTNPHPADVQQGIQSVQAVAERFGRVNTDTDQIAHPSRLTIQVVWTDSAQFIEHTELGAAELWSHTSREDLPFLWNARVSLSTGILDYEDAPVAGQARNRPTAVLHELVHAVGVGHNTDPTSFMHPEFNQGAHVTDADHAALLIAGAHAESCPVEKTY
ncbi:MAG: hypothetical protein GY882_03290 [Actinomycetia bacterium]|nr:hypothetical protein [Actinomycetes bacterium]MCP4844351.1 hypothetical protein [Actinomycetes bacterium]